MTVATIENKINNRTAKIGIIGLGYVGLPLALELAAKDFVVYGFDINSKKINDLIAGYSYLENNYSPEINSLVDKGNFLPTNEFDLLKYSDIVIICVPTPLDEKRAPDTSYISSAVSSIKKFFHNDMLIILESTTFPGTTEMLLQNEFASLGYQVGKDYYLCYSPERIDPGNSIYKIRNTPVILGGATENCSFLGELFYKTFVNEVNLVSSPKIAEMSKLIENTFRNINIAFVNELALMSEKMGIDIWEALEASNTKPFGFMKFDPGPGIGGHCIPIDPIYLSWQAKNLGFDAKLINLAQEINNDMPFYVFNKIKQILNSKVEKPIVDSKVLLLGIAYKANTSDIRESPSIKIYEMLKKCGVRVDYQDSFVQEFIDYQNNRVQSINLDYSKFQDYDCVVHLVNHSTYTKSSILENSKYILDTKNFFDEYKGSNISKLGCKFNDLTLQNILA